VRTGLNEAIGEANCLAGAMTKRSRLIRSLEIMLAAAAIMLTAIYAIGMLDRWISSQRALRVFDAARARSGGSHSNTQGTTVENVDFSLWSEKRLREYTESLSRSFTPPLAVLNVPRLKIRVPVLEGTDELVLNRGVGWIIGTAKPGETGNSGIAGHRDGFFRALKDIAEGDEIRLETAGGVIPYKVDLLKIVPPEDVSVLAPRYADSLTLVTCYPFYFVGNAPERWIVHAVRQRITAVP
jgi:sortase A